MIISRVTHAALLGLCYGILLESSNAFAPLGVVSRNVQQQQQQQPSSLCMSKGKKSKKKKKKLTSTDIINRAREKVGLPVYEDDEPLFNDDLLEDMQAVLLNLEKRVKDGPGSLDAEDVTDFETKMERIVEDMKKTLAAGDSRERSQPTAITVDATTVPSSSSPTQKFKAPVITEVKPTFNPAPLYNDPPTAATVEKKKSKKNKNKKKFKASKKPSAVFDDQESTDAHDLVDKYMKNQPSKVVDLSNDEGPAWDGTGGLGMAKGTRSTYVIPGMDEMTPEEYRAALQESVSARQTNRKSTGVVGNMSSQNYLDNLS